MAQPHKVLSGVGDGGHTRISHKRAAFTAQKAFHDARTHFKSVVLVIADKWFSDIKMVEELECDPRILRGDKIAGLKRLHRSG